MGNGIDAVIGKGSRLRVNNCHFSIWCTLKSTVKYFIRLTHILASGDIFAVSTMSFDLSVTSLIVDDVVPTSINTLLTQLLFGQSVYV